MLASYRGTPIVLIILAALVLGYTVVMNRSVFGRHVYARGGNLLAAQLSGVNTKAVDFWLFVNMGVLAASPGSRSPPAATRRCPVPATASSWTRSRRCSSAVRR